MISTAAEQVERGPGLASGKERAEASERQRAAHDEAVAFDEIRRNIDAGLRCRASPTSRALLPSASTLG